MLVCLAFLLITCPLYPAELPADARAALNQASELAATGQFKNSEEILQTLAKSHPDSAEVRYHLGLVLLRQKRYLPAANNLELAAKLDPASTLVWLALAQVRLATGNRPAAFEAAGRAGSLSPAEPPVWRALSMFYAQAGDFAQAGSYERRWAQAAPADRLALLRAAEHYLRAGQADPAIELATQQLSRQKNAAAYIVLGRAYRLQREPARAVEAFQEAIRLQPGNPESIAELAQLFLDHNTPEPARILLEDARRRFPGDAEIARLLGLTYYAAGNSQRALDEFLQSIDLDPNSELGYAALETLIPDAGTRLEMLVKKLLAFSRRHPSSPLGHYLLALAAQQGDTTQAEPLLRKALSVEPAFWPAWFELHKIFQAQENLKEAAAALEKTIELKPDHAPAHYSLAQVYARMGETAKSIQQRKLHHQLMIREREEAERRRQEMPKLSYEVRGR